MTNALGVTAVRTRAELARFQKTARRWRPPQRHTVTPTPHRRCRASTLACQRGVDGRENLRSARPGLVVGVCVGPANDAARVDEKKRRHREAVVLASRDLLDIYAVRFQLRRLRVVPLINEPIRLGRM